MAGRSQVGLKRGDRAAAAADLERQVGAAPQPDVVPVHHGSQSRRRERLWRELAGDKDVAAEHDLLAVHLEVRVGAPDAGARQRDADGERVPHPAWVHMDVAGEVAPDEDQVERRLVVPRVELGERPAVALERDAEPPPSTGAQGTGVEPEPDARSRVREPGRGYPSALGAVGHRVGGRLLDLDPARAACERRSNRQHGEPGAEEGKACERGATLAHAAS